MANKKDLKTITAAAITVNIGGRELKAKPLTIGNLGDLESWMQESKIAMKIKTMRKSGFDNREIMSIIDAGSTVAIIDAEGQAMLRSAAGILYVLFLSFQHHQPELTHEDVKNFEAGIAELADVGGRILALSFGTGGETEDEVEDQKNGKPAKTKQK